MPDGVRRWANEKKRQSSGSEIIHVGHCLASLWFSMISFGKLVGRKCLAGAHTSSRLVNGKVYAATTSRIVE